MFLIREHCSTDVKGNVGVLNLNLVDILEQPVPSRVRTHCFLVGARRSADARQPIPLGVERNTIVRPGSAAVAGADWRVPAGQPAGACNFTLYLSLRNLIPSFQLIRSMKTGMMGQPQIRLPLQCRRSTRCHFPLPPLLRRAQSQQQPHLSAHRPCPQLLLLLRRSKRSSQRRICKRRRRF